MEFILRHVKKSGLFGWLYAVVLCNAFQFYALHYLNSSYLGKHLTSTEVGFMFSASSALTLIVLLSAVLFLARFGNYYTVLGATLINFTALVGLSLVSHVGWIFVFFVLHMISVPVTLFCLDVFMENFIEDESTTGSARGIFLSVTMLSALFSPVVSGWVVGPESTYEKAYALGALYLVPTLLLIVFRFRNFVDPVYKVLSPRKMVQAIYGDKDIFHISFAQLLLRFYFSWMVIFLPIYLHSYVGFSWLEIGTILFIMLIPYILIQYPAGVIADRYLGEKEMLITGFIIMSASTAMLFFLQSTSVMLWGFVLFTTRIGAALIETMTETYFFKKIDGKDASVLSLFRVLRPFAYILGPLTGGILLIYIDMQMLWLILSAVVLVGIWNGSRITDTR